MYVDCVKSPVKLNLKKDNELKFSCLKFFFDWSFIPRNYTMLANYLCMFLSKTRWH